MITLSSHRKAILLVAVVAISLSVIGVPTSPSPQVERVVADIPPTEQTLGEGTVVKEDGVAISARSETFALYRASSLSPNSPGFVFGSGIEAKFPCVDQGSRYSLKDHESPFRWNLPYYKGAILVANKDEQGLCIYNPQKGFTKLKWTPAVDIGSGADLIQFPEAPWDKDGIAARYGIVEQPSIGSGNELLIVNTEDYSTRVVPLPFSPHAWFRGKTEFFLFSNSLLNYEWYAVNPVSGVVRFVRREELWRESGLYLESAVFPNRQGFVVSAVNGYNPTLHPTFPGYIFIQDAETGEVSKTFVEPPALPVSDSNGNFDLVTLQDKTAVFTLGKSTTTQVLSYNLETKIWKTLLPEGTVVGFSDCVTHFRKPFSACTVRNSENWITVLTSGDQATVIDYPLTVYGQTLDNFIMSSWVEGAYQWGGRDLFTLDTSLQTIYPFARLPFLWTYDRAGVVLSNEILLAGATEIRSVGFSKVPTGTKTPTPSTPSSPLSCNPSLKKVNPKAALLSKTSSGVRVTLQSFVGPSYAITVTKTSKKAKTVTTKKVTSKKPAFDIRLALAKGDRIKVAYTVQPARCKFKSNVSKASALAY